MDSIFNEKAWKDFLNKFSAYTGSLSSFCKENNITKSQFYYYKKRFLKPRTTTFHAMTVNNEGTTPEVTRDYPKDDNNVKIEIGKAKIHIPIGETEMLKFLIKELLNHAEYR